MKIQVREKSGEEHFAISCRSMMNNKLSLRDFVK